jgi:2-isopropylmalate synthase
VFAAAIAAGARTINVPDTVGYTTPFEYEGLITRIRELASSAPEVVVSTHCHDDLGLATANSLAGVRAGARQVECTINGIGERAGNAALEEIVMAIGTRPECFGVSTSIDTRELLKRLVLSRRVLALMSLPTKQSLAPTPSLTKRESIRMG